MIRFFSSLQMQHLRAPLRMTALACAFGMMALSSANAVTVTTSLTLPTEAKANPLASSTFGDMPVLDENVIGSISQERRSPWDAPNSPLDFTLETALYSSIRTVDQTSGARASAIYSFDRTMRALSLVWGSVGPQNSIGFFLNGQAVQRNGEDFILFGGEILTQPNPNSVFVTVSNLQFDELVFTAGRPAFEFANLNVIPIPLPASLPLLAAGLAALGFVRRRQKMLRA